MERINNIKDIESDAGSKDMKCALYWIAEKQKEFRPEVVSQQDDAEGGAGAAAKSGALILTLPWEGLRED